MQKQGIILGIDSRFEVIMLSLSLTKGIKLAAL
jgi:hypothetical protein